MNTIATFRKCTLSNEDLIKKVDEMTDNIFKKQEVPSRHIPARPDSDYDLLVGELMLRFKNKIESEICKCTVDETTGNTMVRCCNICGKPLISENWNMHKTC